MIQNLSEQVKNLSKEINDIKVETRNNADRILALECEIFADQMDLSNEDEDEEEQEQQHNSSSSSSSQPTQENDNLSDAETIKEQYTRTTNKGKQTQKLKQSNNSPTNDQLEKMIQDLSTQILLLTNETASLKSQRIIKTNTQTNMEPQLGSK